MLCPACGTDNGRKFRFCVKCGCNLENPDEVNYEQVDMGNYHSENDVSSGKFTLAAGTFRISDNAPRNSGSDLYTADELNTSDEEFDFSIYDEPTVTTTEYKDRTSIQKKNSGFEELNNNSNFSRNSNQHNYTGGMPDNREAPQYMNNMGNPYAGQMYGQPMMYSQPQIIGYDPTGMPIYGQPQPMMYAQPQIIGYDPTGSPIYGPPMMYAQPQIIGYDSNGMPIYGQPVMYAQPQIIGYDSNGMPIYGQPPIMGTATEPPLQSVPYPENTAQKQNPVSSQMIDSIPSLPELSEAVRSESKKPEKKETADEFWDFFNEGKTDKKPKKESSDDFFGKSSHKDDMGGISIDEFDFSKLQKKEKKKNSYMNDTPLVNAGDLKPNQSSELNRKYMQMTDEFGSSDLKSKKTREKRTDYMGSTKEVDVSMLSKNEHYKSRVTMHSTGDVNANDLEAYTPKHKKAIMAEADHAVEAMPKKNSRYIDELDQIELPAYMQARKTVKEDKVNIPSIPEV